MEFTPTEIKELLECIDIKRFNCRENKENIKFVLAIGQALYGATFEPNDGLKLWRSYVYPLTGLTDREKFIKCYESLDTNKITLKTLGWYARIDNKEKYDTVILDKIQDILFNMAKNPEVQYVAQLIYLTYWLDLIKYNGKWYIHNTKYYAVYDINKIVDDIITSTIASLEVYNNDLITAIKENNSPQDAVYLINELPLNVFIHQLSISERPDAIISYLDLLFEVILSEKWIQKPEIDTLSVPEEYFFKQD